MLLKTLSAITASTLIFASQSGQSPTAHATQGETRTVIVRQVLDGDTFVTSENEHVRVWGINSPERDEAGYWAAGLFLDLKARGRELRCKVMDTDKYSRTVMQCVAPDGVDIGSYMVETGYARDFVRFSKGFYKSEEDAAKKAKRGLWNPKSDYSPHLKYTP
ncbi:MAG: hypothetical protein E6R03_12100 [Hyphomicrobiaceae bacterium]|nr:MAG: hypothetical protein E6R03_12100 [Hyphomicrobiaceae bacterium]